MFRLKTVRVIVAFIFMVATTTLFLHITPLLKWPFVSKILEWQYVPSFLKFVSGAGWAGVGFIVFTLLTLLLGRVYCSFVCPLGILQDVFIRIHKIFQKKKRYNFNHTWRWSRHIVTALAILSLVFGSTAMVIWLDPYSHYGRISTYLWQPIFYLLNNGLAWVVNKMGFYTIYHIDIQTFQWGAFLFALSVFSLLLFLTRLKGRFFCNSLCPVGGILSWFSKISIFQLAFDSQKCISCSRCEKVCKAESIDYKAMKIDFDRCISCYNCIQICPENAISYHNNYKKNSTIQINQVNESIHKSRRQTIKAIILAGTALSGFSFTIDKESFSSFISKNPAKSKFPVIPPGAISISHFKDACTACHLCVSACPSNVLQATFLEFGIDGMFLPKLNFDVNYCQYECKLCGDICPTGAIQPLTLENKKIAQLGKVQFIKDNCVVSQLEKDCGACAEHCPTKAVKMVPYPNKSGKALFIPEVDTNLCIGCGACEHPCPVRPHKAIYVESNVTHLIAQKPVIEKIESETTPAEEFPF